MLDGRLPPRVVGMLAEWSSMHRDELRENWNRARNREPLLDIEPLD